MDRNPDTNLDTEPMPDGCYLQEGKFLPQTARSAKIPWGIGYRKQLIGGATAKVTHGLIIRLEDKQRMIEAIERKRSNLIRKGGANV